MKFFSVCSGIEAASCAWPKWECVGVSEIDAFPSAVLAHHYPGVHNYGDLTQWRTWPDLEFDLLVGGTPCQSFSVAGKRQGMDDVRGRLLLSYLGVVARYRPRWLVWENVPGVLSSNGGRDFGAFLGALAKLGYGFAYRVLDAQYFGVPQRRRRVFVVGHLGDWRRAAAVLFERESLRGDTAPRRETGQTTSGPIAGCSNGEGSAQTPSPDAEGRVRLRDPGFGIGRDGDPAGTITAAGPGAIAFHNRQDPDISGDVTHPLGAKDNGLGLWLGGGISPTLTSTNDPSRSPQSAEITAQVSAVYHASMTVRRLTPRECERLQGFPDDYTLIPYRGKPASDGPRYKALGNSMAVPVMRWIGERINRLSPARIDSVRVPADA
jgi:DNA (cytosine-5)-methyltransferase 1